MAAKKRRPKSAPAAAAPPPNRLIPAIPFLVIGAGAFLVRALAAYQVSQMPVGRMPSYDALEYLMWARRIATFDFTWAVPPSHAPLYPFFLGLLLFVSKGSLLGVRLLQSVLGASMCVVVALAGRRWFGDRAGIAAGVVLALYAPLIWIDVSLLAESLLIFLLALLLWSLSGERHPAVTGIILGLAGITRPTALVVLPLVLIAGARNWKARLTMAIATVVVILPVTFANWHSSHAFIPIQSFGGMNFYLGSSPLRDGTSSARPGADWERIEPEAARHGFTEPAAEDRYFVRKTWSEIGDHPGSAVLLLIKKAVWTFQNDEVRDTDSFYFYQQFAPVLRWLPAFTLLFALAVAGAVLADWRSRATWIAAAYVGLSAVVCVTLVVGARYRMPIVIGLALFAGIAVRELLTQRMSARAIVAVCAGLLLGACTRLWQHPLTHNFAEDWALTASASRREGDPAAAEEHARAAIAIDPSSALAWNELGLALEAGGRLAQASEAFQHATSLNGQFSAAHEHDGEVSQQSGNLDRAVAEYALAAQADPRNLGALKLLGDAELARGEVQSAEDAYGRFVALQPGNTDVLFALARVEGALKHPERGLELFSRGAALRDPVGQEWLLQATLAIDAHQFGVTEAALKHAGEELGPDPRVGFVGALSLYRQQRLDEATAMLDDVLGQRPDFAPAATLRRQIAAERAGAVPPPKP